mmetsp:Transcript_43188/g.111992  ORF Transcript_43188/g.111992 Transcript_43188/m.111992 type:complete len:704 (-) Transcript_43188:97-2208(-)
MSDRVEARKEEADLGKEGEATKEEKHDIEEIRDGQRVVISVYNGQSRPLPADHRPPSPMTKNRRFSQVSFEEALSEPSRLDEDSLKVLYTPRCEAKVWAGVKGAEGKKTKKRSKKKGDEGSGEETVEKDVEEERSRGGQGMTGGEKRKGSVDSGGGIVQRLRMEVHSLPSERVRDNMSEVWKGAKERQWRREGFAADRNMRETTNNETVMQVVHFPSDPQGAIEVKNRHDIRLGLKDDPTHRDVIREGEGITVYDGEAAAKQKREKEEKRNRELAKKQREKEEMEAKRKKEEEEREVKARKEGSEDKKKKRGVGNTKLKQKTGKESVGKGGREVYILEKILEGDVMKEIDAAAHLADRVEVGDPTQVEGGEGKVKRKLRPVSAPLHRRPAPPSEGGSSAIDSGEGEAKKSRRPRPTSAKQGVSRGVEVGDTYGDKRRGAGLIKGHSFVPTQQREYLGMKEAFIIDVSDEEGMDDADEVTLRHQHTGGRGETGGREGDGRHISAVNPFTITGGVSIGADYRRHPLPSSHMPGVAVAGASRGEVGGGEGVWSAAGEKRKGKKAETRERSSSPPPPALSRAEREELEELRKKMAEIESEKRKKDQSRRIAAEYPQQAHEGRGQVRRPDRHEHGANAAFWSPASDRTAFLARMAPHQRNIMRGDERLPVSLNYKERITGELESSKKPYNTSVYFSNYEFNEGGEGRK